MAWDIYGNNLRRGYCEVHPDVPQEYPCMYCMRDIERDEEQRYEQHRQDDLIRQHYEQQEREHQEENELKLVADNYSMVNRFLKTD